MKRLLTQTFIFIVALFAVSRLIVAGTAQAPERAKTQALSANMATRVADTGFSDEERIIERDASGQFHLVARVNGEETNFLIDTGADVVALTEKDAERLGLDVRPEDFQPIMQTASGVGKAARVQLESLELEDTDFGQVPAVVVEGLEVNLLGQSVLRRLGKVELQGDRMVIHHP